MQGTKYRAEWLRIQSTHEHEFEIPQCHPDDVTVYVNSSIIPQSDYSVSSDDQDPTHSTVRLLGFRTNYAKKIEISYLIPIDEHQESGRA